jgi:Uma2 family endonuclease
MTLATETDRRPTRHVRPPRPLFFPTDEKVPESKRHLDLRVCLYTILKYAFADRAIIGSDQFVYWDPTDPGESLSPDVFLRLGDPDMLFPSWKVWERGAPHLAIEIVSDSDVSAGEWVPKLHKYHRLGANEVVRFDPERGELRIWDNVEGDLVERVLSPAKPAECSPLGLFWVVTRDRENGPMLRLARDAAGSDLLPTPEEAARSEAEVASRERDLALERVRILEAELAKRL